MTATIQTTDFSAIAAAGLGRKAKRATDTLGGTTIGTATNGEVWVGVSGDAAPDAAPGRVGGIDPAPEYSAVVAGATIIGRDFRRIMAGVVPAVDTETSRYALGGTLVEIAEGGLLTVVGTDGRRLHAGHVQPVTIHGQASPIIHAGHWQAFNAAVRGVARQVCGAAGKRIDAVVDRGTVSLLVGTHQPTGGQVVVITWASSEADGHGRSIVVRAIAVALAGRFPRWRDCFPNGGQYLTVDAGRMADAVAEYAALHRDAERAGKAAWKTAQEEKKRQRRYHGGEYRHPAGIDCHSAGMIGGGAEWFSVVPAAPVQVKLDHHYLGDALAGAAAWGATAVVVGGTDKHSAVTLTTAEHGSRFEAVIMPLSAD